MANAQQAKNTSNIGGGISQKIYSVGGMIWIGEKVYSVGRRIWVGEKVYSVERRIG